MISRASSNARLLKKRQNGSPLASYAFSTRKAASCIFSIL
jgi:hypothetical protein